MMMNSDDIIKAELLDKWYQPLFDKKTDFFGISKVTYVKFGTWEARLVEYGHAILGIGKCLRREVVERMKGELYPAELNRLLDDNMLTKMMRAGVGHALHAGLDALAFDAQFLAATELLGAVARSVLVTATGRQQEGTDERHTRRDFENPAQPAEFPKGH